MARKVIWSTSAANDKDEILGYWLFRNGSYAYPRMLNRLIHQTIKLLSKNPPIGRKTPEDGIRCKLVRDYFCFINFPTRRFKCL